jgi:predicted nucleotidyltransferase component of viral defense system
MEANYKRQVALLLGVLPEVAKESCFALHGGTAINLFVRDMPRLSVDIDLTYIPIEDRATSLKGIITGLNNIKKRVEAVFQGIKVVHTEGNGKLLISNRGALVKIEVNLTNRGLLAPPQRMALSEKAQSEFDVFCTMPVVPLGQLYGGKIVAALDRQHPRDLFDVKYLLQNEGFTDEIKKGFLLCLLGSDRPIYEVIQPNFQDQRQAMENQFTGMTEEEFAYEDYEVTRVSLAETIRNSLTDADRGFLLSVNNVEPNWTIYDFSLFPSIQWKLQNLSKLKESNPEKHLEQMDDLRKKL